MISIFLKHIYFNKSENDMKYISLNYEPVKDYAYYEPISGNTINLNYTYTQNMKDKVNFYGEYLPYDIVVMVQFDSKVVFIKKNLEIAWTYPSSGIFVKLIKDKIYCSNIKDVNLVDVLNLNGEKISELRLNENVNNISYYENTLTISYSSEDMPVEVYEYNSDKIELGDLLYKTISTFKYPRDAKFDGKKIYVADTFGHRIIVEDILKKEILKDYPSIFPNELQINNDFLYIVEEHNDRILSINLKNDNRKVLLAPPISMFWNTDFIQVPKNYLLCKVDDYLKSISSDFCSGSYTLYSPNGFRFIDEGLIVADSDNHRIIYIDKKKNIKTIITGLNNPVKFDIVR